MRWLKAIRTKLAARRERRREVKRQNAELVRLLEEHRQGLIDAHQKTLDELTSVLIKYKGEDNK